VRGMDPAAVGEAVGTDLAVDLMAVSEVRAVQAWRRSRSRRASVREIVARVRV
jgi:hypothetical protein